MNITNYISAKELHLVHSIKSITGRILFVSQQIRLPERQTKPYYRRLFCFLYDHYSNKNLVKISGRECIIRRDQFFFLTKPERPNPSHGEL